MTACRHLSHTGKFTFSGFSALNQNTHLVILQNHICVAENSRYDSPERQTFATEGWLTAGDFLQQEKTGQTS